MDDYPTMIHAAPDLTGEREPWMDDALCAQTDPEAFFPPKGGSTKAAKRICDMCDVREQCLEYALRTGQHEGVWGGLSARERARMRKDAA
ncbi:MAG: WhiB family transcriptional regulator [Microcella pacifica]